MARDQYLQHFGRIGTGDVLALAQEIDKERERAAAEAANAAAQASASPAPPANPNANASGNTNANANGADLPPAVSLDGAKTTITVTQGEGADSQGLVNGDGDDTHAPPKDAEGDVKMEER